MGGINMKANLRCLYMTEVEMWRDTMFSMR